MLVNSMLQNMHGLCQFGKDYLGAQIAVYLVHVPTLLEPASS